VKVKSDLPDSQITLSEHMRLVDELIVEQTVYLFGHQSRSLTELINPDTA
jgi:hypothetical protein